MSNNPTMNPSGSGLLTDSHRSWGAPCGGFPLSTEYQSPSEQINALLYNELTDKDETVREAAQYVKQSYMETEFGGTEAYISKSGVKSFAYESTSPGACRVINPLPQFGRDDDIVPENMVVDSSGDGIGYVYQKMYMDNMKICWIRAGYPRFNSIKKFMAEGVDAQLLEIMTNANTSISTKLGTLVGSGIAMAISIPATALGWLADTVKMAAGINAAFTNSFKYCSFKSQQHLYFKAWTNILVQLQTHMELGVDATRVNPSGGTDKDYEADVATLHAKYESTKAAEAVSEYKDEAGNIMYNTPTDTETSYTTAELEALSAEMPFAIAQGGDIVSILGLRASRRNKVQGNLSTQVSDMAATMRELQTRMEEVESVKTPTFVTVAEKAGKKVYDTISDDTWAKIETVKGYITSRLNEIQDTELVARVTEDVSKLDSALDAATKKLSEGATPILEVMGDLWEGAVRIANEVGEHAVSRAMGDLNFIGFRMEQGMSVTESMSNSYGKPDVAAQMESLTGNAITKTFNTLQNTGLAPIDAIAKFLSATVTTAGSKIPLGGVGSMLIKGGGRLDFPNCKWEGSSTSGKSIDLTMDLFAPNPTPENVYQHIYIPLAGAIALAFPRGVGKNAYSSPFVVQAYIAGQVSIPLGVVSSIKIERGDSEYGWTRDNLPKRVKVSLTIEDLSPMMYISMTDVSLFEFLSATTSFQDYMMTLSGTDLTERLHSRTLRAKRMKLTKKLWSATYFNPAYWGNKIGSSSMAQVVGRLQPVRSYRAGR